MKINSVKGFTLVETLTAVSLSVIVILIIYKVFAGMTNVWYQNTAQMETNVMVKKAMNTMVQELKRAQLSSITTGGAQDNSTITFKVPYQSCDVNNNNCTWLYGADRTLGASVTYLLSSGKLVRQIKDVTNVLLSETTVAPNVSKLDFALATSDAFIQGQSGNLDLNSAASKPKTYNIKIEYQASLPIMYHMGSTGNRVLTNTLTSRVTAQNV